MTIPLRVLDVAVLCAARELSSLLCIDEPVCPGCEAAVRRAVVAAFESAGFSVEGGGGDGA